MVAAYNKGKGKGNGCFICGSNDHWSKECPKGKERMSALTEEEGQQEGNQKNGIRTWNGMVNEWYMDDYDWSHDWMVLLMIGQVTGRGPKMTGTGPMTGLGVLRKWWSAEQPSASALPGLQSTANALQDSARSEPSQDVAAVTVGSQEQNAAKPSRTVVVLNQDCRLTCLLERACLLVL